jgi:hypothetical protein
MMSEASIKAMGFYIFKTNDLCVFTGYAKDEARQSSRTIIKIVEGGGMLSKGMEVEHNYNCVMTEDEILSSHGNSQGEDYTQILNEIVKQQMLRMKV